MIESTYILVCIYLIVLRVEIMSHLVNWPDDQCRDFLFACPVEPPLSPPSNLSLCCCLVETKAYRALLLCLMGIFARFQRQISVYNDRRYIFHETTYANCQLI